MSACASAMRVQESGIDPSTGNGFVNGWFIVTND